MVRTEISGVLKSNWTRKKGKIEKEPHATSTSELRRIRSSQCNGGRENVKKKRPMPV